jgi:hypothetical protein
MPPTSSFPSYLFTHDVTILFRFDKDAESVETTQRPMIRLLMNNKLEGIMKEGAVDRSRYSGV